VLARFASFTCSPPSSSLVSAEHERLGLLSTSFLLNTAESIFLSATPSGAIRLGCATASLQDLDTLVLSRVPLPPASLVFARTCERKA
jgi:hypothetical protein